MTLVAASLCLSGCFALPIHFLREPEPEWPTVDGPEAASLTADSKGFVLSVPGNGTIEILRLRDGNVAKHVASRWWRIRQLAGPDRRGRILYVKEGWSSCRLMLTTVEGGEATELLSRTGTGSFWKQRMFSGLALANEGGRFAFAVEKRTGYGHEAIEVWNVDGPTLERTIPGDVLRPSWSQDGRKLTYCRMLPADEIPTDLPRGPLIEPAREDPTWPVWFEMELSTGEARPLAVSRELLGEPPDYGRVPGLVDPVGTLDGDLLVYWGNPTSGMNQKLQYTLQKVPERMLSLKVADCKTGEFVTVIPYIGRFHMIRCGDVDPMKGE
jgi:hypothetical protein